MNDTTPLQSDGWQHTPLSVARLSGTRRLAVWVIAVLFTLFVVHWSERNGRLAQDITYDDVQYLVDGVEKQQALDSKGFPGLTAELVHRPPHSAFSTLLALASFEVLGVHDWAPYAFNFFVLVAYLLFCCRGFGNLPSTAFYCLLIFCLTIPFALFCIHEFRPDFADALATAAFVWYGLAVALGKEEEATANTIRAGLLLGAALWIKPVVFPHTLAIAMVVGAGITASGWLPGARKRFFAGSLFLALCFGVIGLVVALPYYVVNGRHTFDYFFQNTQGAQGQVNSFEGSAWSIFRAFVLDGMEALMIGRYLWLLLACCAAGIVWAVRSRQYRIALQIGGLLFIAAVSLAIFVFGRQNSEYLGFYYQIPVLAAALAALSPMIRASRRAGFLAPALLVVALTPMFLTPRIPYWALQPEADPVHGWNHKIVSAIVADSGFQPGVDSGVEPSVPVFVGFAGAVSSESMKWIGVKERLPFVFSDALMSNDLSAQLRLARASAYVVVCTQEARSVYTSLPSSETFTAVLEQMRRDPGFREIKVTSEPAAPYRLFRNTTEVGQFAWSAPLAIEWPTTGLKAIEGPYPQWNLPKVRWGIFPGSSIVVTLPAGSTGSLHFIATAPAGASVKVKLNGEPAGEHLQQVARPEVADIPLTFRAGENVVTLDYSFPDQTPPPGTLAFLYREFQLTTGR